jgi:hypothetical protein
MVASVAAWREHSTQDLDHDLPERVSIQVDLTFRNEHGCQTVPRGCNVPRRQHGTGYQVRDNERSRDIARIYIPGYQTTCSFQLNFTLVACQDEVLIRYVGTTHRGPSRSLLTRGVCIRCNSSEADEIEDRMAHSPSSSHMNSC